MANPYREGIAAGEAETEPQRNPYLSRPWKAGSAALWEQGRLVGQLKVLKKRRPEFWKDMELPT